MKLVLMIKGNTLHFRERDFQNLKSMWMFLLMPLILSEANIFLYMQKKLLFIGELHFHNFIN